ncbi:ABC transporter permease subunit [Pigmentiphaga sp. GD03639]|uniref:ABC transporter permease n=1 Tax=Pigmentiphaga daeguensis TaxID=414049 RepID=A0ABN1CYW3_9BURK|nr:ABC transporter permease subunit [Pigmentiphaga sp. GD03639]MDH2235965.1 ABC transporter permease subunit [Pigmentiphaga sp. GD03639]
MIRAIGPRLRGLLLPLLALAAAEAAMRASGAQSDAFARPTEILRAMWTAAQDGSLAAASAQTLGNALLGLAAGGGIGLVLGLWFGASSRAGRWSALTVNLLRPLPSVALVPIAMLAFGFGYRMESAVVAFTCVWPMLMFAQDGVARVEPRLVEVARVLGLGGIRRAWKIVLPAALPRIFVGLRLSLGIALTIAVTTEIIANPMGLGYGLAMAQQSLNPALMLALVIWIGVLGWAANAGLLWLQARLFARRGVRA